MEELFYMGLEWSGSKFQFILEWLHVLQIGLIMHSNVKCFETHTRKSHLITQRNECNLVSNVPILRLLAIVSCKRPIKCSNRTVMSRKRTRATRQFCFLAAMNAPALSVTLTEVGHRHSVFTRTYDSNLKLEFMQFPGIKYEDVCLFKITGRECVEK